MEEDRDDLPPERIPWFAPWRWSFESQWELLGYFILVAIPTWIAYLVIAASNPGGMATPFF